MKVRVSECEGVSPRTEKPVNVTLLILIRDDMFICDHQVGLEDFRILGSEINKFKFKLKERLFIKRDKPTLNTTDLQLILSGIGITLVCHFE